MIWPYLFTSKGIKHWTVCDDAAACEAITFRARESISEVEHQIEDHLSQCEDCRLSMETLIGQDWWSHVTHHLKDDEYSSIDAGHTESCVAAVHDAEATSDSLLQTVSAVSNQEMINLLDPPKHPEMLGRIGPFDISEVIGQGGMGIVFKAFDHELNRSVGFIDVHFSKKSINC